MPPPVGTIQGASLKPISLQFGKYVCFNQSSKWKSNHSNWNPFLADFPFVALNENWNVFDWNITLTISEKWQNITHG